jgi:hypothetical protein
MVGESSFQPETGKEVSCQMLALSNRQTTSLFDVLTSIVSFILAPSTRGGVAYGVKLTLYQLQQLPRLVGGALLRKQQDGGA